VVHRTSRSVPRVADTGADINAYVIVDASRMPVEHVLHKNPSVLSKPTRRPDQFKMNPDFFCFNPWTFEK
jgi:hypothetical protein